MRMRRTGDNICVYFSWIIWLKKAQEINIWKMWMSISWISKRRNFTRANIIFQTNNGENYSSRRNNGNWKTIWKIDKSSFLDKAIVLTTNLTRLTVDKNKPWQYWYGLSIWSRAWLYFLKSVSIQLWLMSYLVK